MTHTRNEHWDKYAEGIKFDYFEGCSACRMEKARQEIKEKVVPPLTEEQRKDIHKWNESQRKINRHLY